MSSYLCEVCGCVDNSACSGNYWTVLARVLHGSKEPVTYPFVDDFFNNHFACVACCPQERLDNGEPSIDERLGKWHNNFPREHWSHYGKKEKILKDHERSNFSFENAIDYFEKYGDKGHWEFRKGYDDE